MYDLEGSDSPNEFVELFNPSETDSIDLTNWTLKDRSSEDALIDSGFGLVIPPQSYGIILEGDYALDTGLYQSIIPENTILIKVDDSSIGNGLSTTDSLFLMDSNGVVIDSLGWEDWAQDGFSLERIRLHLPNTPTNWAQSIDSLGTPGSINSVLPDSINLMISELSLSDSVISQNETTTLIGKVANVGLNSASPELQFFIDGEYITNEYIGYIDELDTVDFEIELGPFTFGEHSILVTIIVDGDLSLFNNSDSIVVGVRYPFRTILLNEFMCQPNAGYGEFVEIVNGSNELINLEDWAITDNNLNLYQFPSENIESNQFGIIASDSSYINESPNDVPYIVPVNGFPTLNNGGDAIRIYDPFATLIDSLLYDSNWDLSQGISQEKMYINDSSHISGNWSPSISENGHTLGTINSVTPAYINGTIIESFISYLPEIPSNSDQVTLFIPIKNSGLTPFNGTVSVSDSTSILGQSNFASGILGDTTMVELNIGLFLSGFNPVTIDLIIDGDEQLQDNSAEDTILVRYPFGTVLLNEFLPAPNNDQSEFVECITFDNMTLLGWGLSDNHKTPSLFNPVSVESDNYIVIVPDSTLIHEITPSATILILPSFPSLNNSGDGIYIFDHTGSIIDSLIYDSNWPITSERSTEKLRETYESNNSQNWDVADENIEFTPGFQNSQMLQDTDGSILQNFISYSPTPPSQDSSVIFSIPIKNEGVESFSGSITVELADEEIGQFTIPETSPNDTTIVFGPIIAPQPGAHSLLFILDIPNDSNYENNIASSPLLVRYPFGAVLINEFLPIPDSLQSEFVELIPTTSVQLDGWSIQDVSGSIGYLNDISVETMSYIVITDDSSLSIPDTSHILFPSGGLPSLNNSTETFYVLDHTHSIVDSVQYSDEWGIIEGRSFEKFRLNDISNEMKNWGISIGDNRQTPGRQNSIYFSELPAQGEISLTPNPFSPDGDSFDDELKLTYSLPFESAAIRWEIFDVNGRKIATPYYNYYVGQNGELIWDGKKQNGSTARIGIYIMKISFQDQRSTQSWESVKTIVLAKRL